MQDAGHLPPASLPPRAAVPNAPDDGLLHTLADIPGLVQPSGTASAITGTPGPGVLAWTTTEPRDGDFILPLLQSRLGWIWLCRHRRWP